MTDGSTGWSIWDWPFFESKHRLLSDRLQEWQAQSVAEVDEASASPYFADECRRLALELARWGFLDYAVPSSSGHADVRAICLIREALAYKSALADNVFVMQGLGTAPIWLTENASLIARYVEACRRGERIAAIAVTEPDAGSDVAAISTTAFPTKGGFLLNGEKLWITNAGVADQYLVLARTEEGAGARGLSMFAVDASAKGLHIGPPAQMIAPHPIAGLSFRDCFVPESHLVGTLGGGFKLAMSTFDIFRTSVGAAAIGMARRALDESRSRVKSRRMFGGFMSELPGVQSRLSDMVLDTEAGALLVYRAAWMKDTKSGRVSREVAMAKLGATEAAQRVIDSAVQLFGGLGVSRTCIVEQLYRDIRPLRIYEGASDVQKLVIAREYLRDEVVNP